MKALPCCLKTCLCLTACLLSVHAQSEWPRLRLVSVAGGFENPVDLQNAHDNSGRLFVVEQSGRIRILRNGSLLPPAFLDLRGKVIAGGERGLLGLAFPPGYAVTKDHFYVNYTEGRGAAQGDLRTVIARYKRSAANPDVADPASEERILTLGQPYDNHNGGQLTFGPDGMLYIGTGDGGSGGDPLNSGQTTNSLLGKMLRIDPESAIPYAVPATNPFRSNPGYRPEIWALGLRNPWRFSFDSETGDLWIADVGQSRLEEVNFQPRSSGGGENYGWRTMEGTRCYNPASGCSQAGLTLPIWEYDRTAGISITGGFVYRGTLQPSWSGTYFVADYGSGRIWALRRNGSGVQSQTVAELGASFNISSFGVDEKGELYVARHGSRGEIFHLVDMRPAVAPGGVVNAASYKPGVVPGGLVTIFGAGVAGEPGIQQAASLPLPLSLSGSTVFFDEYQAPIQAVASVGGQEQVNVQVPWEVASRGTVTVTVVRGDDRGTSASVDVLPAQPGVFTSDGVRGIVADSNSGVLVTPANAAGPGDLLTLYLTGLGQVTNQPPTGAPAARDPLSHTREPISATIAGRPASVSFSGLAPDFVGLYQVNLEVPTGVPSGDQDLIIQAGAAVSATVKLAIR